MYRPSRCESSQFQISPRAPRRVKALRPLRCACRLATQDGGGPGSRRASLAIALSAVLAVIGTTAWFWLVRAPADQDGAQAAANLKLEGPAVVVAPFEDLTGTESGRLLAGGLTQELITNLMRFEDLRVYAASSNERWAEDPCRVRPATPGELRGQGQRGPRS